MALWIQNVTPDNRSDDEPHDYVLRLNQREMARFQHLRSAGAAACLRAAAEALDDLEREKALTAFCALQRELGLE